MKFLLFGTGDYYERYKKWFERRIPALSAFRPYDTGQAKARPDSYRARAAISGFPLRHSGGSMTPRFFMRVQTGRFCAGWIRKIVKQRRHLPRFYVNQPVQVTAVDAIVITAYDAAGIERMLRQKYQGKIYSLEAILDTMMRG